MGGFFTNRDTSAEEEEQQEVAQEKEERRKRAQQLQNLRIQALRRRQGAGFGDNQGQQQQTIG